MFGSSLFYFYVLTNIHFRFCLCPSGFFLSDLHQFSNVFFSKIKLIFYSEVNFKLFFIEDGKSSDKNSEDYEKNITELFELVDKNKSKTIDLDELKLLSPKMSDAVAMLEKADTDKSGDLSVDEFKELFHDNKLVVQMIHAIKIKEALQKQAQEKSDKVMKDFFW